MSDDEYYSVDPHGPCVICGNTESVDSGSSTHYDHGIAIAWSCSEACGDYIEEGRYIVDFGEGQCRSI